MKTKKESFSTILKKEMLEKKAANSVEAISEIYGLFYSRNSLRTNNLIFKTELLYIVNRLKENFRIIKDIDYKIEKEKRVYTIIVNNFKYTQLDDKWVLRGYFISSGYIRDPKKTYSLDFFIDYEDSAQKLYDILKNMDIKVLMTNKKENEIVYVRNNEDILDIIVKLDAINSFFKYEETTINKEIKLKITRNINYELANETKKLTSSNKQIRMIEKIDKNIGITKLTAPLQELAKLRLEYQELSLQELATKLNITKSGVRNRFRRLQEIYDDIGE